MAHLNDFRHAQQKDCFKYYVYVAEKNHLGL